MTAYQTVALYLVVLALVALFAFALIGCTRNDRQDQ